jgi:hypothetical protein
MAARKSLTFCFIALTACFGVQAVIAQKRIVSVITSDRSTGCITDPNAKKTRPTKISGGILNGTAIDLPKPIAVRTTAGRKLSGKVSVQVVIGEDGSVISAFRVSGDDRFRIAAETAAMHAKFKPTLLDQSPAKVSGLILYRF